MSDSIDINSNLGCDISEFEASMLAAGQNVKTFRSIHAEQMDMAAQAGKQFGLSAKTVFKQWVADTKAAEKQVSQILRDQAANAANHNKIMNDALKGGNGGRADLIHRANKEILKMADPNAPSGGGGGGSSGGGLSFGGFALFTMAWDTFKAAGAAAWNFVASVASSAISAMETGIRTIFSEVNESITRINNMYRKSGNLDITIGDYQRLEFTAHQTGTAIGTLEMAMRTMEKNAGKATFGDKGAKDAFAKMGIDPKQFALSDVKQQLLQTADAFEKITNTSQKYAVASKIWGRSGGEMLQFLKEMKKDEDVFNKIAVGVNELDGQKVKDAFRALGEVKTIVTDIWNQFTSKISPAIINIIHITEDWGFTGKNATKWIDEAIVGIKNMMTLGLSFGMAFKEMWPQIWTGISSVFKQIVAGLASMSQDLGTFVLTVEPAITALTHFYSLRDRDARGKEIQQSLKDENMLRDKEEKSRKNQYESVMANKGIPDDQKTFYIKSGIERTANQMAVHDKNILELHRRYEVLMNEQDEELGGHSALERLGQSLQQGSFKPMFGKDTTNPFDGIVDNMMAKMKENHNESKKIVDDLFIYKGTPEDRKHGGGPLSIDEDEKKEKAKRTHSSPLGYAINATNTRASLTALRLAHTQIQQVGDSKTHELLGQAVNALKAHSPNVTTLQD